MRTTISITEDLLKKAQRLSGKSGYSEAIVRSLQDYVGLRERLAYLENLFFKKAPHSLKNIKKMRKQHRWSS
jgi:Arc/MetJ family transcription regulator